MGYCERTNEGSFIIAPAQLDSIEVVWNNCRPEISENTDCLHLDEMRTSEVLFQEHTN